jgi:hypothetical protein
LRRFLAGAGLLLLASAAEARPVTVTVEPIGSFQRLLSTTEFGPFAWRGGLTLSSDAAEFGGFSGLVLGENCNTMLAVSDKGSWLQASLVYDGAKLAGVNDASMAPVRDGKGKPPRSKVWGDAEALARLAGGGIGVGCESRTRFGRFDIERGGLDAKFQPLPFPDEIDDGPSNGEVEAFGQLPDGRFIAIAEKQFDAEGNALAWAWRGEDTTRFAIARHDEYRVTDLAIDGGSVLTLERRFSTGSLPGVAIRRFAVEDIAMGRTVAPELLFEATAPLYVIDNMEALAICTRDGETRVTLMSDDNFNSSVQSTIILQFAYRR